MMNKSLDIKLKEFTKAMAAWLEPYDFTDPEAFMPWDQLPADSYDSSVSDTAYCHISHMVSNIAALQESLQELKDVSLTEERFTKALTFASPFAGGSMCEIKYMYYEFGPLYYNIMNRFLQYVLAPSMRKETVECIRPLETLVKPEMGSEEFKNEVECVADNLRAYSNIEIDQSLAFGNELLKLEKTCLALIDFIENRLQFWTENHVWYGFVILNSIFTKILSQIILIEPLWARHFLMESE